MLKTISLQQAPSLETIERDLFNILSHDELDEAVITHVLTLLDQHPPLITALDTHHRTLLHIAAKKGHLHIMTALHQAGANIQATDHSHKTPLHMAAETGQLDSVIYLVETAGANVQATANHGDMGLNWSSMWRVLGDMQSVLTGISMTQGKTPFHIAVEEGHITTAKYFVDTTEVNLHTLTQTHKNNLLIDTTKKGYLTFVKALLQAGADANTINEDDDTPLHIATELGHVAIVKALLNADTAEAINQGALQLAIWKGHLPVVKVLIEEKKADITAPDAYGDTPLHLATARGNLAVVKYVTEKAMATVNAVNNSGETPLHMAARAGLPSVVHYLVNDADAQVTDNAHKWKGTPLQPAAYHGHLEIVRFLNQAGAHVNATDKDNKTPLHSAAENNQLEIVAYLVEETDANVLALTHEGLVPLALAHRYSNDAIVTFLNDHALKSKHLLRELQIENRALKQENRALNEQLGAKRHWDHTTEDPPKKKPKIAP